MALRSALGWEPCSLIPAFIRPANVFYHFSHIYRCEGGITGLNVSPSVWVRCWSTAHHHSSFNHQSLHCKFSSAAVWMVCGGIFIMEDPISMEKASHGHEIPSLEDPRVQVFPLSPACTAEHWAVAPGSQSFSHFCLLLEIFSILSLYSGSWHAAVPDPSFLSLSYASVCNPQLSFTVMGVIILPR